jgi:hypothetical protein
MGDYRDIQHGVNDPVSGVDVKRGFNDNKTPHECAQTAADVRADPSPVAGEAFLPEALRRPPTSPSTSEPAVTRPNERGWVQDHRVNRRGAARRSLLFSPFAF